jgi:large subunit ribosomal protein L22
MADVAEKKGYTALVRYLLVSPFKVRRIASNIRRKPYSEAISTLEAMPHKAARQLKKVISSAAANALYNNKSLDEDMLYIKELQVDEGPRMKRLWPRARGRADRLLKRMTHIRVVLDEIGEAGGSRGTES